MDATIEAMELLGRGKFFNTAGSSPREFGRQIQQGLPRDCAVRVIKKVSPEARERWRELILSSQNEKLCTEMSEKAVRLAYVLALSKEIWGTWAAASQFLSNPHPELDGKTPFEATASEWGSREVEALLRKIQFGLPV